jgi:hypothetical protein
MGIGDAKGQARAASRDVIAGDAGMSGSSSRLKGRQGQQ